MTGVQTCALPIYTQDPVLRQLAGEHQIPFIPHQDVNSAEYLGSVAAFGADLFVSMSFNQIFREEIIGFAPLGLINCHAGALPFYRGRNPLNWALINDADSFGITVHYVDGAIDTGDIIRQNHYPVSDEDTYASLLERAVTECASTLYSAITDIRLNQVKRRCQTDIHPTGTYFSRRIPGDEIIDFQWSSRRLFNFIRAITLPGPGARCRINGTEYAVLEARMIADAPCYIATEGEILGRSEAGNIIKTGDSTLLITRMVQVTDNQLSEPFTPRFPVGTRCSGK